MIAVSQSGRSPDLVAVVEAARAGGATTIAIANDAASPLAVAAAHVIDCRAGEERSVAATKSYVAQLAAGAALVAAPRAVASARGRARRDAGPARGRPRGGPRPSIDDGAPIVEEFAASERSIVISRGFDFPTALETALKLKETSRLFAEGYSSADFSHGPVVLSGPGVPVLAIRPPGRRGRRSTRGSRRPGRRAASRGSSTDATGPAGAQGRLIALPLPADLPRGAGAARDDPPGPAPRRGGRPPPRLRPRRAARSAQGDAHPLNAGPSELLRTPGWPLLRLSLDKSAEFAYDSGHARLRTRSSARSTTPATG